MSGWKNSLVISGGMMTQQIAVFLGNVLIARSLGPADFGVFAILKNVYSVLIILAPIGLDLSLLKYGGIYVAKGLDYRSLYMRLRLIVLILNALALALYLLLGDEILQTMAVDLAGAHLFVILTLISAAAGSDLQLMNSVLKSNERPQIYSFIAAYFVPLLRLVLNLAGLYWNASLGYFIWVNMLALALGSLLLTIYERVALKPLFVTAEPPPKGTILVVIRESVWMVMSLFQYGMIRFLDVLALGMLVSTKAAGEYSALSGMAQAIQIYPQAIATTIGPRIAGLMSQGKIREVEAVLANYMRNASRVGGFIFAGIAAFGNKLDLVFGAQFSFSAALAFVLCLGWYLSACYAPVGYLLSMVGRHKLESFILNIGTVVLVVALYLLIPPLGALGAGLAVLLAFSTVNFGRYVFIVKQHKIRPASLRDFYAPTIFLLVGAVFSLICEQDGFRTFPILVLCCAGYSLCCMAIAYRVLLSDGERAALGKVLQSRGLR